VSGSDGKVQRCARSCFEQEYSFPGLYMSAPSKQMRPSSQPFRRSSESNAAVIGAQPGLLHRSSNRILASGNARSPISLGMLAQSAGPRTLKTSARLIPILSRDAFWVSGLLVTPVRLGKALGAGATVSAGTCSMTDASWSEQDTEKIENAIVTNANGRIDLNGKTCLTEEFRRPGRRDSEECGAHVGPKSLATGVRPHWDLGSDLRRSLVGKRLFTDVDLELGKMKITHLGSEQLANRPEIARNAVAFA
jgi:hypothetical protein